MTIYLHHCISCSSKIMQLSEAMQRNHQFLDLHNHRYYLLTERKHSPPYNLAPNADDMLVNNKDTKRTEPLYKAVQHLRNNIFPPPIDDQFPINGRDTFKKILPGNYNQPIKSTYNFAEHPHNFAKGPYDFADNPYSFADNPHHFEGHSLNFPENHYDLAEPPYLFTENPYSFGISKRVFSLCLFCVLIAFMFVIIRFY